METTTRVNPRVTAMQLSNIGRAIDMCPNLLRRLLTTARYAMLQASAEGVRERPMLRSVEIAGKEWLVSRFAAHGTGWVGIRWPADSNKSLARWLKDSRLGSDRSGIPDNEVWIYLGSSQ